MKPDKYAHSSRWFSLFGESDAYSIDFKQLNIPVLLFADGASGLVVGGGGLRPSGTPVLFYLLFPYF